MLLCQLALNETDPNQVVKGSVGPQLSLGKKKAKNLLKGHIPNSIFRNGKEVYG